MERKASAVWKGGLKDGKGTISAPGGVLKDTQYSFTSRFENGPGTNPRRVDCGGARGVFFDGAFGAIGRSQSDAGEHQHERHPHHGKTGFWVDHYIEPH